MRHLNHLFLKRWVLYSCSLVFITWLLVGCIALQEPSETFTPPTTSTTETPSIVLPTATVTVVTPTNTPVPTQTPLPSLTNTPLPLTLTPTLLPTFTPVPTLTYEEEGELLQGLMATNGGCDLPCWWGIRLGDTLTSVGKTFIQRGAAPWRVTTSRDKIGYIDLGYYDINTGFDSINTFMQFYAIEGIVQYIKISGSHESLQSGLEEFIRDWEKYHLPTILQMYGTPSLAYLRPGNPMETGPSDYTLLLYYSGLGINISYNFRGAQLGNGIDEVCFTLENVRYIQVYLYNPEFAENWPIPQLLGLGHEGDIWLIENELGMDLDTFYETYRDVNNLGCVQVTR